MRKFVVERPIPAAGTMQRDDWREFAVRCNEAVDALAGRAQWLHTYVTEDKVLSIFLADTPETLDEHAKWAGQPYDSVREIRQMIDPTTAAHEGDA